jgi:hypothetical protein
MTAVAAGPTQEAAMAAAETESRLVPRWPPPARNGAPRAMTGRQVGMIAVFAGIGAVAGFFAARVGVEWMLPTPESWQRWVVLASLPLAWWLVVAVHELGHLVGGWLVGGRFLLWAVGPVIVQRTPEGFRVAWNRNFSFFGGVAACLPLDVARATPRSVAVMVCAGPLASLALVVTALWMAAWLSSAAEPVTLARAWAQNVALVVAALSAVVFVVASWPSQGGGFKSDGRRVFELLRGDARSDQEAALLALTTLALAGVRPADYEPALVRRALALGDGSLFDLYGRLTVYYHAADLQDWRAAQEHLDVLVAGEDRVWPEVRGVVRTEYAWMLATVLGPNAAAVARAWLETAAPVRLDPAATHRARAAVLWAEGRRAEAVEQARLGLVALERHSVGPVRNPFVAEALERVLVAAGGTPER